MPGRFVVVCAMLLSAVAMPLFIATPVGATAPPITCNGQIPTQPPLTSPGTLVGTSGNDVLIGSTGNDLIKGGKGDDVICGGLGSDRIEGGDGIDFLIGESDNVAICPSGFGDDVLLGGAGADRFFDVCGNNTTHGDAGNDNLELVSGTADGGSGEDFVFAVDGFFSCGGGNRRCVVARALGGSSSDQIFVGGGTADGGSGDDAVGGTVSGDILKGGSGSDVLSDTNSLGNLTLNGGSARDTCDATGNDVLISCEVVV